MIHSLGPPPPLGKNGPHAYDNIGWFDPFLNITDNSVLLTNCGRIKAVKPLDVQESVSGDSEAPDIMFICSMVDYGILRRCDIFSSPKSVFVY